MKKLTKWLALLLAGLTVSATLLACDSGYDWSESDDDDDDEEQSESFDQYKKLSPEEFWDALLEAKDYTISASMIRTVSETTLNRTVAIEKDQHKIKWEASSEMTDGTKYSEIIYIDLNNQILYEQGAEDAWETEQNDDITLEAFLKDELDLEYFFDTALYGEYDADTSSYPMIPEKLLEKIGGEEGMVVTGSLSRKGVTYTLRIEMEQGEMAQTVEFVFTFQSVSVKLPEAKIPEGDVTQQPAVTDKVPVVTQQPDAPKPPVTEKPDIPEVPDIPVEPEEPDAFKDPMDIFVLMGMEDSCEFTLETTLRRNYDEAEGDFTEYEEQTIEIYKEGNRVRVLYNFYDRDNYDSCYIDLDTGYVYLEKWIGDDSYWVYEEADYAQSWEALIEAIFTGRLDFFLDSESYPRYPTEDYGTWYYQITQGTIDRLSGEYGCQITQAQVNLDQSKNNYSFYYREFYTNSDSSPNKELFAYIYFDERDHYISLPDEENYLSPDEYEEKLDEYENEEEEEKEPVFDQTPYRDLPLDQLFDALLTTEELYILWEQNRDQVVIEKSGDIIEIGYYYSANDTARWYYIDLANQIRYDESKGYQAEEYTQTWEELLETLGIVRDAFFLQEETYLPFDESTTTLEVDPDALDHSFRSAVFKRYGYEYRYEEQTTASRYTKIVMNFKDTNTKLPI